MMAIGPLLCSLLVVQFVFSFDESSDSIILEACPAVCFAVSVCCQSFSASLCLSAQSLLRVHL